MSILGQKVSDHCGSSWEAVLWTLVTLTGWGYNLQTQQKFVCGFWQSRSHAAAGPGHASSPAVLVTQVLGLAECLVAITMRW